MKRYLLTMFVALGQFVSVWGATTNDARWTAVRDAVNKGLPKTAITNLEPMIAEATARKDWPEAVRAIAQKIALEGTIEGSKPEERITRMHAALTNAVPETKPLLETILAHWYWHYFQQNRWRFMQRTATGGPPGEDFTTWDLPRLFREIALHFDAALSAKAELARIPVSTWDGLLEKGTMPDELRPTLYDFLAHEALQFYTSGEQAGARPEDAFELSADSPVLGTANEFTAWSPEGGSDTNAAAYRALKLYQDLLRFHAADPAPRAAFANVDLERIIWAGNTATGDPDDVRYQAALETFTREHADLEVASRAYEAWARSLLNRQDQVKAHELATRGATIHPNSPGAKLCRNIVREIEAKSAQITTERIWYRPQGSSGQAARSEIEVRYRNIEKLYFRVVPVSFDDLMREARHSLEMTRQARQQLLQRAPVFAWSETLPKTADYKERRLKVPAPESRLTPGYYCVLASFEPDFAEKGNQISVADVWVSRLTLVMRQRAGNQEVFVMEAESGEPVAGANVFGWQMDQQGRRSRVELGVTDANGFFSFNRGERLGIVLAAKKGADQVTAAQDIWAHGWDPNQGQWNKVRVTFFTDRAIYRPGQTIQYKGICAVADQTSDTYEVKPNEEVEVVFRDPNNEIIATQKTRANAFGSFSGSFTAPRDRLMGPMTIEDVKHPGSAISFRVEEYKRPKFEVKLGFPAAPPRLGDKVILKGSATSYTGAAVDDAKVSFRVVREVRLPWWCRWWWGGRQQSQEIGRGIVRTDVAGNFEIPFVARPDASVPATNQPVFEYSVHADVTDSTGETRSDQRQIRVGYTALEASLSADEWQTVQKPVRVRISTRTLDGDPQVSEGQVKIYSLQPPSTVVRSSFFGGGEAEFEGKDLSNPTAWPTAKVVFETGFTTTTNGTAEVTASLKAGAYRAVLETQDRFGKTVTDQLQLTVVDPQARQYGVRVAHFTGAPSWTLEPGEELQAIWGTGYKQGRAYIEIEHRHKLIKSFWTPAGRTQQEIRVPVTEAMRGGFTVHITQVRENRAYLTTHHVEVPWSNKELVLKWSHFTSKLQPGQKETWTIEVNRPPGQPKAAEGAELLAALYDASLDAFLPHSWPGQFSFFRRDYTSAQKWQANQAESFGAFVQDLPRGYEHAPITYRTFPSDLTVNVWHYGWFGRGSVLARKGMPARAEEEAVGLSTVTLNAALVNAPAPAAMAAPQLGMDFYAVDAAKAKEPAGSAPGVNLAGVTARKNLSETAFFFPHLVTEANGVVRFSFTMPEALTRWKFLGFAHDKRTASGFLTGETVTAKDLMVQPNPPRFLREGDVVEFTVKVSNQSDRAQRGRVRLGFQDANSQASGQDDGGRMNGLLGLREAEQSFDIPAKQSRGFSWRITVPDGCGFLAYKAVAATATVSDGEEGGIPVLSRRILVTESLPLPIRGPGEKTFQFGKLLESGKSDTLRHQGLTVQMVSNPAWYAVMALPYLMEFPYECSEQTFNRFYANALAQWIASSDPKIERIFEQWRNTPALDSPLEKNEQLKSVALEETPWLLQARSESAARRNVGILFDRNRLASEQTRALRKLTDMQIADGRWPWFPGGLANDYITLYITTGFGRLRHLGLDIDAAPAIRSLTRLDAWMTENYERIQRQPHPEEYVPSSTDALYLYGRSFFLKDQAIGAAHRTAVDFFLKQSQKYWLQTNARQTQGHLALALQRFAKAEGRSDGTPMDILRSLRERSVSNEEMGMFWRDTEYSWWWYRAPIETQALMIEALDEVAGDKQAVEDCKVWLLKQKQTQDWKTTKATADAVYALLLRGRELLSSDALVQVSVGGLDITPGVGQRSSAAPAASKPEAGTGFYEVRYSGPEVKPTMGDIKVRKVDEGVAWGSVHWQYLEDMAKVTPHEGTPLKLKKALFIKENTAAGPALKAVSGPVSVGDELVVRIELRVDRDMEYVHMKDQRGSGTEPVNVLSRYQYQDGLGYYESTRDTASHFFIDYLPKGTYVFEYSTRVQLRGAYQTGVAEIQCMYAPEFNSHSESIPLRVE